MNDGAPDGAGIQRNMLDAVGDALTAVFIIYDKNDRMVFASRQALSYFPIDPKFLQPGTRLREFLGAVYDSGIRQPYGAARQDSNVKREDWIAERIASHWRERADIVERHASDRWIRFTKRRLSNGFAICVIADVSEHKKREEQWRADLERVQLTEEILDNLPFPVFVKDRNLAYVAVNKAFCTLRGLPADELLGRTLFEVMDTDIAARLDKTDRHVMETGMTATVADCLVRADGTEAVIRKRKQRVGKPGRYFLVTTLENVSDLTAVGTRSAVAEDPLLAARRGTTIISSPPVSEFRHQTTLPIETIFFDDLAGLRILLATPDHAAETAAIATLERLGFEACSVRSDQELSTFLDVARSAGVGIDLVLIDSQMNVDCLDVPQQHGIDVLTLDGFQLKTELAYLIVKHFNHRRVSDKASAPELTTSAMSASKGLPESVEPAEQVQVLVAEDNDINRIVFSQILEGLGLSYRIAGSGDEAVLMWQRHAPQLVLMDITLPGLNGFEAACKIRLLEQGRSAVTPIIGVLPQAFDHDRTKCLESGMDDVILKPLSPDILEAVFRKFIGEAEQRRSTP